MDLSLLADRARDDDGPQRRPCLRNRSAPGSIHDHI
jgi:hypothetical protein